MTMTSITCTNRVLCASLCYGLTKQHSTKQCHDKQHAGCSTHAHMPNQHDAHSIPLLQLYTCLPPAPAINKGRCSICSHRPIPPLNPLHPLCRSKPQTGTATSCTAPANPQPPCASQLLLLLLLLLDLVHAAVSSTQSRIRASHAHDVHQASQMACSGL